jgi:CheY-specific phosphatase CheX
MANLSSILNDPNYVNANAETKAAIFDKFSAQDKNYTGANSETQQAIRVKFGIESAAAPELSMREKIMGAIETPFALGATLAGGAIAPIVGVAGTLASGKYGTQEGIRAGEEAAKSVMYQPRTQVARQALSAVGEFLQPVTSALPPTLGAAGSTINALAPAVATQANVLARPIVRQATVPVQNALAKVMTREQPVMPGVGAASTAEDLMRQQRLDKFNIRSTVGEREKNLAKQQFESDVERGALAGISQEAKAELAKEYGAFKFGQRQDILNEFERMTEEVGGTIDRSTPRALGTFVDKTMLNLYEKKLKKVDDTYQAARDSGETKQIVGTAKLEQWLADNAPEAISVPQIQTIGAKLEALKKATNNQVSIDDLENIYKVAGNLSKDNPSAATFMGQVKGVINEMTEGTGGDFYRKARMERKQLAKEFENVKRVDDLLSTKAGKTDRKVALDDVYNHIVVDGSLEEMRSVTQLLKKGGPEGQKAYQELQGYTLQRMKDLLLKKADDETDKLVLNKFNNFVTQLDREDKLAYMFGKTGRDTLIDLKKSINDVMVKEPGAVNYPNTAGAVVRSLEALQKLPVKIPGVKTAAEFAREMQYKKQLEESLKQPNQLAPKQPNQNALTNKPVKIDLKGMAK